MSVLEVITCGADITIMDSPIPKRDGVLNVCKPENWTSHDVVASVRKQLGYKKVGHGGTLDPAATGVLPILLGKATRISEYLMDWDKEYAAVLRLGASTDTQDATGNIIDRGPVESLSPESIHDAVTHFQGSIEQIPPMYSAVKVGGRPLYKAARAGEVIERSSRRVTIHAIDVEAIEGVDVSLRVRCSKGTYIRTLCSDIGQRLGVGGHLLRLTRMRVGPLAFAQSVDPLECSRILSGYGEHPAWIGIDAALSAWPVAVVEWPMVSRILNGSPVALSAVRSSEGSEVSSWEDTKMLRVHDPSGSLLGLGKIAGREKGQGKDSGSLVMVKVLADASLARETANK